MIAEDHLHNFSKFKESRIMEMHFTHQITQRFLVLFFLSLSVSVNAHNNEHSGTIGENAESVEHAEYDDYWAEKAKNESAFDPATMTAKPVIEESSVTGQRAIARAATAMARDENIKGKWSNVINWPHVPVSAANLPDGRVLTFASNKINAFPEGSPEFTYASVWNPSNGQTQSVNHNSHDMFCGHLSMLEDGRLFVNGGRSHVRTTSTFDYKTNTWQKVENQNRGRWYPTTVALPDGRVFTALGSTGGEYPEVWTKNQGWKVLTGASMQEAVLNYTTFYERNWWPLLHVNPRGNISHTGPTPKMHEITTTGLGSIKHVGPEIREWYPKHGTTVMYDVGKLLVAGGAISGSNQRSTNKAMTLSLIHI